MCQIIKYDMLPNRKPLDYGIDKYTYMIELSFI